MDNEKKLALGFEYFNKEDIESARKIFYEVLSEGYRKDVVYYGLGCCNDLENNIPEAINDFRASIQITPNAESYYCLGGIYKMRSVRDAESCYKEAIRLDPSFEDTYINLSGLLTSCGRIKEAKDYCEKAIEINPNRHSSYLALGDIYIKIKNLEKAEQSYHKALSLSPERPSVHLSLAALHTAKNDFGEAERYYNTVLQLDPYNKRAYFGYGLLEIQKGFLERAQVYYQKALELDPQSPGYYTALGDLYNLRGDFNKAVIYYKKAVDLAPCFFKGLEGLGELLMEKGQIDEAKTLIEKAIESNPYNAHSYSNLANIYYLKGQLDSSNWLCNKAIEIDAKLATPYCRLGYNILHVNGSIYEAEKLFKTGLELDNKSCESYNGLGIVEFLRNNLEDAVKYHSTAAKINPYDANTFMLLSRIDLDVNSNKDMHFYRYVFLLSLKGNFREITQILKYAESIEAFMLIFHVVEKIKITAWEKYSSEFGIIKEAIDRTALHRCLMLRWQSEDQFPTTHRMSSGIINYYTGDPIEAYRIFDYEIEGNDLELDLMGQYYLCLASAMIMEEEAAIFGAALRKAEAELQKGSISETEKYYAGLIYYLNGHYTEAIAILEGLFPIFLPAGYKLIEIHEALFVSKPHQKHRAKGDPEILKSAAAIKVRDELNLLESIKPLYKFGLKPITPSHEANKFLQDIMPVIHFMEVHSVFGQIFVKPFDVRNAFFNLIILDPDEKKEGLSLEEQAAKAWQQVNESEADPDRVEDLFNAYHHFKKPHKELGEMIQFGANTELSDIKEKHKNPTQFQFKVYLAVNYRLNAGGYISDKEASCINDYIYHCMDALPAFRESDAITYVVNSVRSYFLKKAIDYIDYAKSLNTLIKLIKKDRVGKTNPIMNFNEFADLYLSSTNDEEVKIPE